MAGKKLTETAYTTKQILAGGALAGIFAGLSMAMFAMVQSWLDGMGFMLPVNLIAGTYFGVEVILGGVWITLAGLITHLVASAVFGSLFALITLQVRSLWAELGLGLMFGVAIWMVMTHFILPVFNPVMEARVSVIPGWWFSNHIIFGAVLVLTPIMERSVAPAPRPAGSRVRRASPAEARY